MLANEISRDAVRGYDLQLQRAKPEKPSQDTKKSPSPSICEGDSYGADTRIRTGDLILTKGVIKLYIDMFTAICMRVSGVLFRIRIGCLFVG